VEKGAVEGGLASLDTAAGRKKKMLIRTPSGSIKLRSNSSRIEVSKKKTTLVSVYNGEARVKAKGKEVFVPKNYGTIVKMGKRPQKPRLLPPSPRWNDGKKDALILVQKNTFAQFTLRWKKQRGVRSYRIEWSHSPKFRQILRSFSLRASRSPRYLIKKLRAKQNYYIRISARSRSGLQSLPSRIFTIRVLALRMSREPLRVAKDSYELSGWVKILPPKGEGNTLKVSVMKGTISFSPQVYASVPQSYIVCNFGKKECVVNQIKSK